MATLLDYPIDKVPDFVLAPEEADSECPYPAWWLALQSWLAERGLWFLEMHLPPNQPWMPVPIPAFCILFGETEAGVKHAIVGRVEAGDFVPVFNPWPEAELNGGVGALGFIIPRDPALPVNMGRTIEKCIKFGRAINTPMSVEMMELCANTLGHQTQGINIAFPKRKDNGQG